MVLFTASRVNAFVGDTCALPSTLLVMKSHSTTKKAQKIDGYFIVSLLLSKMMKKIKNRLIYGEVLDKSLPYGGSVFDSRHIENSSHIGQSSMPTSLVSIICIMQNLSLRRDSNLGLLCLDQVAVIYLYDPSLRM